MVKNSFFYTLIFLLVINHFAFSQKDNEFSLLKTPEQKELEKEENNLKFQDFFFKALKERAQENFDKAISALDECNIIYPNNVAINFEYAKNYFDLKLYENAAAFIEKVIPKKPKETYVFETAVKIYKNLRDYPKAISYQKKLVAINPSNKNTLVYLYILSNQKDLAKNMYAELEKDQLLDNRKDYFKRVLFKKEVAKTTKEIVSETNSFGFKKKQFNQNKSFKNLKTLLEKEKQLQKYNELVIDSSEGLSLFPAQPYVYYINGFALNKVKRYKDALHSLEEGLDYVLEENKTLLNQFYNQIAIAYKGLGDSKNAQKYTRKITQ